MNSTETLVLVIALTKLVSFIKQSHHLYNTDIIVSLVVKQEATMADSKFKPDIYSISYNEKSNGYVVSHGHGTMLTSEALLDLCQGILNFINTYTDEDIEKENERNSEEWYSSLYSESNYLDEPYHVCHFKKNAHLKEGIVYVFQDKASGHVRSVKTTEKSYENSVKNKQSSSFEGIKILYKTNTKHQNLLSEFFNSNAEHIRNNPDYVSNEEYREDFMKWILSDVKITRYKCKSCKDTINSLENRSYIRCSKCFSNFCSVDCWDEHICTAK